MGPTWQTGRLLGRSSPTHPLRLPQNNCDSLLPQRHRLFFTLSSLNSLSLPASSPGGTPSLSRPSAALPPGVSSKHMKMSEHAENATEKIMSSIMDTIADKLPKQKSGHFDPASVSEKVKDKLFGRQRSLHGVLGGGKSADVLLWRNKKISSSVLGLATAIWVFFEWLDYHFLTIISFSLVIGMVVQFVYSNFSSRLSGSSKVPRVELPDELFVNVAVAIGAQAIVGLWAAAVAGSWFNFLTVIYIGFVCAHTLPVLYEKYEDQVDDFLYSILGLLRNQYEKLDQGVLSRIPKGNVKFKKSE